MGQLWKNDIEVAFLRNPLRCATVDLLIMCLLWGEEMAFKSKEIPAEVAKKAPGHPLIDFHSYPKTKQHDIVE